MECPNPAVDGLNFICDYPEGDIRLSVDDWINRDYDYFEFLTPDMRNSSLQLQGPCYPVIFPTVNGNIYSAVILCCLLNIRTNQCSLAYHSINSNFEIISHSNSSYPSVYWSCQFIARASNVSLKHWQQMGGVSIDENILIDKTVHKAIDSRSAVLKVCRLPGIILLVP